MHVNDVINSCYEIGAALLVLNHCRVTLKDKHVAGVSIISIIIFMLRGFWNMYYYPSLGQWWSFFGSTGLLGANVLWVILLLHYRKRPGGTPAIDRQLSAKIGQLRTIPTEKTRSAARGDPEQRSG